MTSQKKTRQIVYRSLGVGEEAAACALIWRAFDRHVAADYSSQGTETFRQYANPQAMAERRANHESWVASLGPDPGDELVGVIELREYRHLSQLFVDPDWHRQGIASTLFQRALVACREHNPELASMTVASSPYAVPVYLRLGFVADGDEQINQGLRYQPMVLDLSTR